MPESFGSMERFQIALKQPQTRARPCPKCSGRGSLIQVTWIHGTNLIRLDPDAPPVKCDRCKGKRVLVQR